MDPQAALDMATSALKRKDYHAAGEHLEAYWEWRRGGGFEPKGGDRKASRLGAKLSDEWPGGESGWGEAGGVEGEGYENPRKKTSNPAKKTHARLAKAHLKQAEKTLEKARETTDGSHRKVLAILALEDAHAAWNEGHHADDYSIMDGASSISSEVEDMLKLRSNPASKASRKRAKKRVKNPRAKAASPMVRIDVLPHGVYAVRDKTKIYETFRGADAFDKAISLVDELNWGKPARKEAKKKAKKKVAKKNPDAKTILRKAMRGT